KTSGPTIASEMSSMPSRSATAAATQCALSARGSMRFPSFEVLDEPRRDCEREHEPDRDDQERRLEEVVPEPLPGAIEEGDAIRLCDRPHDAAHDRERAHELDGERAPRTRR